MAEIWELSAVELIAAYRSGALSPVEVIEAILNRTDRLNPAINAFPEIDRSGAMVAARESERRWRADAPAGRLDGVPISVKELTLTKGMATLRGSLTISPDQAWDVDAPSVANLRSEAAVIFGKTTTSEFGNKIVTESPLTGITRNPRNLERTSGGSSGGAGAAVAAGLGPLALGSDGGGSIRNPANWCGVFGFEPSYASPSTSFSGLTAIGPLARSVEDAALMTSVMCERAEHLDWRVERSQILDKMADLNVGVAGLRIAYSPDLGIADVQPAIARCVAAAADKLRGLGARIEQAAVPPLAAYVESRTHSVQWTDNLNATVSKIDREQQRLIDPDTLALAPIGRRYSKQRISRRLECAGAVRAGDASVLRGL
jgi:aspartyl-tRNA(Asn)/glutamyl-tRNA(Gln) amidotransferase subunit A